MIDIKTTIENAIQRYLVSFGKSLITKFYTKTEVDNAFIATTQDIADVKTLATHDNLDVLIGLTKDATTGDLMFEGKPISTEVVTTPMPICGQVICGEAVCNGAPVEVIMPICGQVLCGEAICNEQARYYTQSEIESIVDIRVAIAISQILVDIQDIKTHLNI